jgi:predicted TPR repeat methyltransferase
LEQAVQLRPEWSDARRALGFALVRSGREADALAQAEAWLRAAPNDPVPRAALEELQRVMDGRRK